MLGKCEWYTVSHLRLPRRISRYSGHVIASLEDSETLLEFCRTKQALFGVSLVIPEMWIPRPCERFNKDAMKIEGEVIYWASGSTSTVSRKKKAFRTTIDADTAVGRVPIPIMQTRDGTQRLLTSTYCPFCTDRYRLPVVQAQDTTDAFSLSNLLPAGTITVAVHDGEPPCRSGFNNRDWHSLPMRKLSTHPADTLFRELAFLAEHRFLRATSRLGASGHIIFIRLYLIPNDLPNVRGRLRCRSKTVVHKGQRYMHRIVPLIEQTDGLWDADEACLDAPQKHFLPSRIVCEF